MSMWNFTHEKNTDSAGANTEAGFIAGNQPFNNADALSSKRNVVATELGWVRRQYYVDGHGNPRTKDEVLVAAHPGGTTGGYANASYLAFPDIATIQYGSNTADGVSNFAQATAMEVVITFNEPLNTSANVAVVAKRRDGTNSFTLTSNTTTTNASTAKFSAYGGNNALVFVGTTPSATGQFKIDAQSLTIAAGGTLVSRNFDGESANLIVTGAVSNTSMNLAGNVLANGEFTIV